MSTVFSAGFSPNTIAGRALIADKTDASTSIPSSPATFIWPNVRNTTPDLQYDSATGVFTFGADGFFHSVASWHVNTTGSSYFYTDAEFSVDGGTNWTRGTNSGREDYISNTSRTLSFPFAGYFPAGLKLRFVHWAAGTSANITTTTNNGSTIPAARLTTTFNPGIKY